MRIFLLADGTSPHTIKWVNSLLSENVKIFLFSITQVSSELITISNQNNFSFNKKSLSVNPNNSTFRKTAYLKLLPQLNRELKQFKPDIVHAHYISSYGLLAYLSGFRPYVLSVWGSDILVFPKRSIIHKKSIQQIINSSAMVFATSQLMLDVVQNEYRKKESMRLPFGINSEHFKPQIERQPNSLFTFIILKSLKPTYGIDIAIEAFKKLKNDLPQEPMRLLIYGDGEKRKEYESLSGQELDKTIFFKGKIPNNEANEALQNADVFLNVSRFESFGVSVLEASACSLPVIVSDKGGLPETILPNKTGIMLEELTSDCCAAAMKSYVKNPIMLHDHGKKGRKFVDENFRQELLAKVQLNEYKQLIGEV